MTTRIPLTQGLHAIIDDRDSYVVNSLGPWYPIAGCHTHYAKNGKGDLMHRVVLPLLPGIQVDHKDGNGLNNRRRNLRPATASENQANRPRERTNKSGYKGIWRNRKSGKWRARVCVGGRYYYGGYHKTPEAAARAYDKLAVEHHGAFAHLNFPEEAI